MPGLALVTPPASEPVTLAEAKLFLRVDTTADDALVTELLTAARKRCEEWRGMAFIQQTWDYTLDAFPRRGAGELDPWFTPEGGYVPHFPTPYYSDVPITLPRFPVLSVGSVKYTPYNSTQQTLSSANYIVDTANLRQARIIPNIGQLWPFDLLQAINGVVIRFDAGYAASAAGVPEQAKLAIKQLVARWYFQRDAIGEMPTAVEQLLLEETGGVTYV